MQVFKFWLVLKSIVIVYTLYVIETLFKRELILVCVPLLYYSFTTHCIAWASSKWSIKIFVIIAQEIVVQIITNSECEFSV
jgi:hypothetical protein